MFEKKKTRLWHTQERLDNLSREQLNQAALEWGMAPPDDSTLDEDLRMQILAQQALEVKRMSGEEQQRIRNLKTVPAAYVKPYEPPSPGKKGRDLPPPTVTEAEQEAIGETRCWFRVAAGATPAEKGDVFAAINGDSIRIKRGVWVKLRKKFLAVFGDALITEMEIGKDNEKIERSVPRFNISLRSLEEGVPREGGQLSQF